jgi:hypothetical protein
MIAKYWDTLDKNHDGVLDKEEFAAMQKMMGQRRRAEVAKPAPAAAPAPTAIASKGGK